MSEDIKQAFNQLINENFPLESIVSIPVDIHLFPHICLTGIYLIYSKHNIIYIGVSDHIGNRLLSHCKNGQFNNKITGIKIIRFNNWHKAANIEAYLIQKITPSHNKKIPQNLYPYSHNHSILGLDELGSKLFKDIQLIEEQLGIK